MTCRAKTRPTSGRLELLGLIEDYRQGMVPLVVPLTRLKHHLNQHLDPKCEDFVKAQITILATAILCGCERVSVPIGTDPVSIPNTITPVPSAISSSTPEDVVLLRTSSGHSKRFLDVAFSARGEFLA